MKTISKFLYALAALSLLAFTGCSDEKEYEPGVPDADGCYGVYFPSQAAAGYHVMTPNDEPVVHLTAARTNSNGAITVPVTVENSEDGVFTVGDINFADGQSETTFDLSLANIKDGKTYSTSITIEDEKYASRYNKNPISIDYSFMRVKMENFSNSEGKPIDVTFSTAWSGYTVVANIQYYEIDGVRHCVTYNERVYDGGQPAVDESGNPVQGYFGNGADDHLSFNWYTKNQNPDGYDYVEVPIHVVGYNSDRAADIYACDNFHYYVDVKGNTSGGSDFLTFTKAAAANNINLSYYDGNGGFYIVLAYPIGNTGYWYGEYTDEGIAEGFVRVDYSLDIVAGQSEKGVLPVQFEGGADVANVKYSVLAGALTPIQVTNAVAAITEGSDASAKEVSLADTNVVAVGVSPENSGEYTLVGVPFDKDGKAHGDFAASAGFKYVAAGDEDSLAVVLNASMTATRKYEKEGYSSDTSLEFWLSGSDLESVRVGVFSQAQVESGAQKCIAAVQASKAVSDSLLNLINTTGWTSVVSGLSPGIMYYLIAVADNGYETDLATATATTTGDPDPIYASYSENDFAPDYLKADEKGFYGKWNLYATAFGGSTLRSKIAVSEITDSKTPNDGPDENGAYDEYVYATGFGGPESAKAGLDDKIELDYYGGQLLYISLTDVGGTPSTVDGSSPVLHITSAGEAYGANYIFFAIPVADGYYAFIPDSQYASYGFYGLWFRKAGSAYGNYLLVDPAKDDHETATTAALDSKIAAARKALRRTNYVETIEGNKFSAYENAVKAARSAGVKNVFNYAPVVSNDVHSVAFGTRRVATWKNAPKVAKAPRMF